MKVLFISKAIQENKASPIVIKQLESLKEIGVELDHFIIQGGKTGYLKCFFELRRLKNKYDAFHAHFSYVGLIASLARIKPLVVSFMGSDVSRSKVDWLISKFVSFCSHVSIFKSQASKDFLGRVKGHVIPNGVDVDFFKPLGQEVCREKIGLKMDEKIILFAANPSRPEKNFELTKKAVESLSDDMRSTLISLKNVDFELMPYYYNAADVVVLSSKYEGSPNVIKEAMSCNRPVVTTDVGDVSNYRDVDGVFISTDHYLDFAQSIKKALSVDNCQGRNYIITNLSKEKIAKQLNDIYLQIG